MVKGVNEANNVKYIMHVQDVAKDVNVCHCTIAEGLHMNLQLRHGTRMHQQQQS